MNDNTDDYFLVNKRLLEPVCFTDKRKLHILSIITIYVFRNLFQFALGASSTRKFLNMKFSNIQLYSLNEYLWEYSMCVYKTYADVTTPNSTSDLR
jgi:hypothetical protein